MIYLNILKVDEREQKESDLSYYRRDQCPKHKHT